MFIFQTVLIIERLRYILLLAKTIFLKVFTTLQILDICQIFQPKISTVFCFLFRCVSIQLQIFKIFLTFLKIFQSNLKIFWNDSFYNKVRNMFACLHLLHESRNFFCKYRLNNTEKTLFKNGLFWFGRGRSCTKVGQFFSNIFFVFYLLQARQMLLPELLLSTVKTGSCCFSF